MKSCKTLESELPDCVISYIFTKLSLKDSVKTNILSKRWIHDWRLRNDLNFDLDNMFDYNTIQELPNCVNILCQGSKVSEGFLECGEEREKNKSYPRFHPIARLHHIENLAMVLDPSQIAKVSRVLVRFQNLRQLELFIDGAYDSNMDYFWILDIAMASRHLQKLSLTIRNPDMENSHVAAFQRQRREYSGFSHNNLKYVELCGSVCTINVIELASHLLRNVNSLKQITL